MNLPFRWRVTWWQEKACLDCKHPHDEHVIGDFYGEWDAGCRKCKCTGMLLTNRDSSVTYRST